MADVARFFSPYSTVVAFCLFRLHFLFVCFIFLSIFVFSRFSSTVLAVPVCSRWLFRVNTHTRTHAHARTHTHKHTHQQKAGFVTNVSLFHFHAPSSLDSMQLNSDDFKQHCAVHYNRFLACAQEAQSINANADYNMVCRAEMEQLQACAERLYVVAHVLFFVCKDEAEQHCFSSCQTQVVQVRSC